MMRLTSLMLLVLAGLSLSSVACKNMETQPEEKSTSMKNRVYVKLTRKNYSLGNAVRSRLIIGQKHIYEWRKGKMEELHIAMTDSIRKTIVPVADDAVAYIDNGNTLIVYQPSLKRVVWRYTFSDYKDLLISAVSENMIICDDARTVLAINRKSRKLQWSLSPYGPARGTIDDQGDYIGGVATSKNTVVFVTIMHCFAVETTTGKVRWKAQKGSAIPFEGRIHGGKYILASDDRIMAWELESGKALWKKETGQIGQFGFLGDLILFSSSMRKSGYAIYHLDDGTKVGEGSLDQLRESHRYETLNDKLHFVSDTDTYQVEFLRGDSTAQ